VRVFLYREAIMGRSRTPKFRIELNTNTMGKQVFAYERKATTDGLVEFIVSYEKSLKPGGVNEHVCPDRVTWVNSAQIVNQKTGRVVAEYNMPMFQAM
jgi:hypothetical protein